MSDLVPDGWEKKQLSQVCDVIGGGTPERSNMSYWGGDIPWLSPTEVTSLKTRYISETKESITNIGLHKSSAKLLPAGTLLMTSRASIGYVAINTIPLATNQGFQSLQCHNSMFNEFLYQSITWMRPELERLSAGSTFSEISSKNVKTVKIIVPPLPEQQKIAAILSSVDEVIEKTQAQINKLKDLKTGMMQELLSPREGQATNINNPQGESKNSLHHTEFKDSPLGRIPVGWEVAKFKDVFVDYKYGPRFSSKDYSPNGNVKTIRGTDVSNNGEVHYQQVPTAQIDADTVEAHKLKDGDLVMITTADCGASAVFREQNIPYIASAYAIKLTPTNKVIPAYIKFFMQTSNAMTQIESFIRKGTVANLPGSDVMNIELALPPIKSQEKISSILNALEDKIELIIKKNTQLKHTKKALMQDLLTGKVRVKVD